jgi:hypothetical protein
MGVFPKAIFIAVLFFWAEIGPVIPAPLLPMLQNYGRDFAADTRIVRPFFHCFDINSELRGGPIKAGQGIVDLRQCFLRSRGAGTWGELFQQFKIAVCIRRIIGRNLIEFLSFSRIIKECGIARLKCYNLLNIVDATVLVFPNKKSVVHYAIDGGFGSFRTRPISGFDLSRPYFGNFIKFCCANPELNINSAGYVSYVEYNLISLLVDFGFHTSRKEKCISSQGLNLTQPIGWRTSQMRGEFGTDRLAAVDSNNSIVVGESSDEISAVLNDLRDGRIDHPCYKEQDFYKMFRHEVFQLTADWNPVYYGYTFKQRDKEWCGQKTPP